MNMSRVRKKYTENAYPSVILYSTSLNHWKGLHSLQTYAVFAKDSLGTKKK